MNISIITINYNNKKGLISTATSVWRKRDLVSEYLVIDGASDDGSQEAVNTFFGHRESNKINFKIISEADNGISDAFNKGIKAAKGDWILLLNSGDELGENYLELINQATNKNKSRVYFGDILLDNDTLIKGDANYKMLLPYVMPRLNHPTCLVHCEVYWRVGGYNNSLRIAMDYEWLKRASVYYSFEYVPDARNIMESTGISNRLIKEMRKEVLSISSNRIISRLLFTYNNLRR